MQNMSIKKATVYNATAKFSTMFVSLALNMILARLLIPEVFGIIAVVSVILNFLALFADIGIGIAVIQYPQMDEKKQGKLFFFSLCLGVVTASIMALLAVPISIIYNDDIYKTLCPLLSIAAFFSTCNIIPNAILIRDKRFDLIALRSFLSAVIPGTIAVVLAYHGAEVYALIVQTVISSVFLFVWNYFKAPIKPKKFKAKEIWGLTGNYSLFQFLFNIINYLTRNLDSLIIGAKLGESQLGYYNKAYTLSLYPNNIFTSVFTGVLHPYLRDYNNNYTALQIIIKDLLRVLSILGVYATIVCFSCSSEIIELLFGDNWGQAIPCFRALSICIWSQMLSCVAGSVFLGIERTDKVFECGLIDLVLILSAIITGVYFESIIVLSWGVGIVYNIIFFITYYILIHKAMRQNFFSFIKIYIPDYVFTGACIFCLNYMPNLNLGLLSSLIYKVLICSIVFTIYLLLTKEIYIINDFVRKIWRRE